MNKHTPGPWHQGEGSSGGRIVYASDGYAVCDVRTHHGKHSVGEEFDNARLIAAAPDLLDALENVLTYAEASIGATWRANPPSDSVIVAAKAAIAKARGE